MTKRSKKKKILVIEDDLFLNKIYRSKLFQEGFSVMIVESGDKAFAETIKFKPDIIILDIILPNKNGWEVLELLQADKKTKKIPVIVVSNLDRPEHIQRAEDFGVRNYLVKISTPIEKLVTVINKI